MVIPPENVYVCNVFEGRGARKKPRKKVLEIQESSPKAALKSGFPVGRRQETYFRGYFGATCPESPKLRKSVVSIKFPPVILGPEMAAPILWAPGIFLVLSAGKPPCP